MARRPAAPPVASYGERQDEAEGEYEWWRVTRDGTGQVIKVEHEIGVRNLDERYAEWSVSASLWQWRPRLKVYQYEWWGDSLYEGKPPERETKRVPDITDTVELAERTIAEWTAAAKGGSPAAGPDTD